MKRSLPILLIALALASCSAIDRLTGQVDNTVLPGAREEAIPGQASFPAEPVGGKVTAADPTMPQAETASAAEAQPACAPDDPACAPPPADETFSDSQ